MELRKGEKEDQYMKIVSNIVYRICLYGYLLYYTISHYFKLKALQDEFCFVWKARWSFYV